MTEAAQEALVAIAQVGALGYAIGLGFVLVIVTLSGSKGGE